MMFVELVGTLTSPFTTWKVSKGVMLLGSIGSLNRIWTWASVETPVEG